MGLVWLSCEPVLNFKYLKQLSYFFKNKAFF